MATKLKFQVENLTDTFLIVRDGAGPTIKIPPRGVVEVAGLTDALRRLDEAEKPLVKITMPRKPGPAPKEAKALLAGDGEDGNSDDGDEGGDDAGDGGSTAADKPAKNGGK